MEAQLEELEELERTIQAVQNKISRIEEDAPHDARLQALEERLTEFQKQKTLLKQAQVAAGAQPGAVQPAAIEVAAALRQVLREDREEREPSKPKGFSSVGATEAERLLESLDVMEVNGNEVEPVVLPDNCPECSSFDFDKYSDENEGTPYLLEHHQRQLEKMKVKFGRGGYKMYDLHSTKTLYTISSASGRSYRGTIDGCVSPYGLMLNSAHRQCRVCFEHKQSPKQKQAYHDKHTTEVSQTDMAAASGKSVSLTAGWKGQAVTALIGACAHNVFPLIMDLIDGEVHHLLQFKGNELYEWTNLAPQQAYFKLSQLLKDNEHLLTQRDLTLEAIPEELQVPMKKLRTLRPVSALKEQLDSIIPWIEEPMERLQVTYELMYPWAQNEQLEMSAAVKAMYS